jgi:hypothetical protein
VNRYWLGPPPEEVKNYSYDVKFADGKSEHYAVDDPREADRRVRQGINFTSAALRLAQNIDKLTFQSVDIGPERIQLMFDLKAITHPRWQIREGVTGHHRGGGDGPVRDGVIVIDAARFVPLEVRFEPPREDRYREAFDDFVEVRPGHYVPRKVEIDGVGSHRWTFNVYEPGLWLFGSSRAVRDPAALPMVKIENVIVNGAAGALTK